MAIINPTPPTRRWTIRVRVTAAPPSLARHGEHQWAIWAGRDPHMLRILKATPNCHFDQASKRWFFFKPAAEYGATLQRLLDLGYRIDMEDTGVRKTMPSV